MNNKRIIKIITLSLFIVLAILINKNNAYSSVNFNDSKESLLPRTSKFSLSMWVKPNDNSYYNKVIKISNDKSNIYVLSNSEDKEYKSNGITISWDNGSISKSNDYRLDTGFWSNLVMCVDGRHITLFLDGNKFIDEQLNISLSKGKINLKLFDEFNVENVRYYDYILDEQTIKNYFEENIDYKFKSLQFNDTYPNSGGKFSFKQTPFKTTYTSNSNDLMINDGFFILNRNSNNKETSHNIQVSITINNKEYTKDLIIKQEASDSKTIFNNKVNEIKNNLNYYMSTSERIDDFNDINVKYKVIKGNATYDENNHKFIKQDNAEERELITIECTVNDNEYEETFTKEIVLLDDYKGYLMVFFNGEDGWPMHLTGDEMLYFSYSDDLKSWKILNKKPVVTSDVGTGRFRDPYINRDSDGNFIITSTEGYYNPGIYITKSNDLSSFETTNVSFNKYDPLLGLKGDKTWAPEFVYNKDTNTYTILFSEGNDTNKGIYAVDTNDFNKFTYPYIYLNTNCNVIDGHVSLIKGKYYLFYKDERENNKNIYYAVSNDLTNPVWSIFDENNLNGKSVTEGPFVIKDFSNNSYYLYLDGFKYYTTYSGEIIVEDNKINVDLLEDNSLKNSPIRVRHFSIIPITDKEYLNIVNYCNQ